jgi:hypothetical protein
MSAWSREAREQLGHGDGYVPAGHVAARSSGLERDVSKARRIVISIIFEKTGRGTVSRLSFHCLKQKKKRPGTQKVDFHCFFVHAIAFS